MLPWIINRAWLTCCCAEYSMMFTPMGNDERNALLWSLFMRCMQYHPSTEKKKISNMLFSALFYFVFLFLQGLVVHVGSKPQGHSVSNLNQTFNFWKCKKFILVLIKYFTNCISNCTRCAALLWPTIALTQKVSIISHHRTFQKSI